MKVKQDMFAHSNKAEQFYIDKLKQADKIRKEKRKIQKKKYK